MKKDQSRQKQSNKTYRMWLRLTEKIQTELHSIAHAESLHYAELARALISEALQARKENHK